MANKEIIDYKDLATVASGDYVFTQTSDETTYNAPTISSILALTPPASTSAKGIVELATSVETTAGLAVQANDTRLSDARTPTAHAASHQDGGSDELALDASQIASGALAAARLPVGTLKTDAPISSTAQYIKDKDGNASVLALSNDNVGIGTTSPGAKLHVNASGQYKVKSINGPGGTTYRKSVILLHEIYNGTLLADNYASGKIFASRGGVAAGNRKNIAKVDTGSAYDSTNGKITSISSEGVKWKLVTCTYNGVKYMAVEVPYVNAVMYTFSFEGYHQSSGADALQLIDYYHTNGGGVLNSEIYNSLADFTSYGQEYVDASTFAVSGKVGIGTTSPGAKLDVNGAIRCVLPTSSSGLSSGDLWNDSGTVKIVT